jgi:hypothetical protein
VVESKTGQWDVTKSSAAVAWTVKSSAWRYLEESVNAETEVLLVSWGSIEPTSQPQWLVSACAKSAIPAKTLDDSLVTKIGNVLVVIPQKLRISELDGKTLRCESGVLVLT